MTTAAASSLHSILSSLLKSNELTVANTTFPSLTAALISSFPNGNLKISNVHLSQTDAKHVSVAGLGNGLLAATNILATFTGDPSATVMQLTASRAQSGGSFGDYFSMQGQFLSALEFTSGPTYAFDSSTNTGITMSGVVQPSGLFAPIQWLLNGITSWGISGPVNINGGAQSLSLAIPGSSSVQLGPFAASISPSVRINIAADGTVTSGLVLAMTVTVTTEGKASSLTLTAAYTGSADPLVFTVDRTHGLDATLAEIVSIVQATGLSCSPPAQSALLSTIQLTGLTLTVDLAKKSLASIEVDVGTNQSIPLFTDALTINQASVGFKEDNPRAGRGGRGE